MPAAVEVFEQIICHQSVSDLVPFLLELAAKDVVPVREKTRKLYKELSEHRQLGPITWGQVGTNAQLEMLFLAGLSTYSQKEALATPFVNEAWRLNRSRFFDPASGLLPTDELVHFASQLLARRRPAWLDVWLGNTLGSRAAGNLDFAVLLKLERLALITPSPRLLALSGMNELVKYGTEAKMLRQLTSYRASNTALTDSQKLSFSYLEQSFNWLPEGQALPAVEDLVFERVARNKDLLARAIPAFFEFETEINWLTIHLTEHQATKTITWPELLRRLTASGHLDRADILTHCLLALRRDFRRPLLTWFKDLFLGLVPTLTERLARQADLVELLAHPLPLVVNFALEQLKSMWAEPGFTLAPLLLYADTLLTRPDLKTGLRTLLTGLSRLPRRDASQAPTVARLLAAALAHPDPGVQERAAKPLAELLHAKKSLLTAAQIADATAAINQQADLLSAPARQLLAAWLPAGRAASGAVYAPGQAFSPAISPATRIAPVADWHELLFLTGEVLRHESPTALERWLDGLLRLRGQLPTDYARQLQPYLLQHFPWLVKNKSEADALTALAQHRFSPDGNSLRELVQALLLGWATGFQRPQVRQVALADHQYRRNTDPLLLAERQRLTEVETQLRGQARPLGLLSTPSHAPHWVAPSALVQRLLAYEAAGHAPSPADLALALARTAWAAEADAAQARHLVSQLMHNDLRELLDWFLAPAAAEVPLPTLANLTPPATGLLQKLLFFKAPPAEPLAAALPWLWAVAARTRCPEAVLAELRPLADYPGVAEAWQPGWHIEQQQTQRSYWHQPTDPTYTWLELRVPTERAGQVPPSPLLLYSQHARLPQENRYYNWPLQTDLPFLLALLPNNPAPLHWHVLRTAYCNDAQGVEGSDLIQQTLRSLLRPGPTFAAPTTALLAVGLTHQVAAGRYLALEVLLAAVAAGRLVPAALGRDLGKLLATGFAPVTRFADLLPQAQGASPTTDDALCQLLEALLPALPATPLRNLRKLLDFYTDLAARTGRPVPSPVQAQLHAWQVVPALKKATALLLA